MNAATSRWPSRSGRSGLRPRRRRPRRNLPLALLCVASIAVGLLPGKASAQDRVEGEYGLWVRHGGVAASPGAADGSLVVGWLTETARPGLLEVSRAGEVLLRRETEEGRRHEVSFPVPDTEEILLRYGAAPAEELSPELPDGAGGASRASPPLHETRIRLSPPSSRRSGILTEVDSLFVVGDVHGEFDSLLRVLQRAELVDTEGRWSGGATHAVFLGDLFDRGADVTRTLWFLYRLEREAADAGGGAHVVLGNHEVMIFTHDLRYVSPKERRVAQLHGAPYYDLYDVRTSVLGRWLARRPAVMKVDDVLMAHGGVTPRFAEYGVEALNDSIAGFLQEDLFYGWTDTTLVVVQDSSIVERAEEIYRTVVVLDTAAVALRNDVFFGDEGPFWYRGYVLSRDTGDALEDVLESTETRIHVVGHTALATIESRYGGRLLAVDLEDAATEGLLLVREPGSGRYEGWRYGLEGRIDRIPVVGDRSGDR